MKLDHINPQLHVPATFSSQLLVNECLLDDQRTTAFRTAIRSVVRPGDVVLDAGTGSGVLALFAAEAGAAAVYAVEVDQRLLQSARSNIRSSVHSKSVQVMHADLMQFSTTQPVDVVIMEMLDTGLITELQAPALDALRDNGVIGPETRVIPERVACYAELIEYDFDFYGFKMQQVIQARNSGVDRRIRSRLSQHALYQDVDLHVGRASILIDRKVDVRIEETGIANAVRLRTQTTLCNGCALWETSDMNMPVVIPVQPARVTRGDVLAISLRYLPGGGYDQFCVAVTRG